MTSRVSIAWAARIAVAVLLAPAWPSATDQQKIYVAVADNKGRPVRGLTAADFRVAIDDTAQEIISVAPATEPLSIVLLTDRLGVEATYTPFDLARSLRTFVKTISSTVAGSHFALTTFDGPVVRVTSFGFPPAELDKILGRLSTMTRDSALRDAVMDVCQTMRAAPTARRAIFTVFAGYKPDMSTVRTDNVGEALRLCNASWWVIEARVTGENSFGNNERDALVDRGSRLSGGMRDIVASAVGIETMAKEMAELIASQYEVTYAPGGGNRNSARKVMVLRPGLKVYAPGWTSATGQGLK
jgi:hypothetical protein